MARGRKRTGGSWLVRIVALVLLVVAVGGAWLWWDVQHWRPSEDAFPDQGVLVGAHHGNVNFRTVGAIGGRFAYLEASIGAEGQDDRFARNFARANEAGLQVGAVHLFDPCTKADGQSANFVTMVPRTDNMLPPAIALGRTAETCDERVSEAAVESELMTFINQVEKHTGKPVILKVKPQFEAAYAISGKLERQLWVNGTRFEPTYAQRPWLLWSANENLRTEASDELLEWVVVRP
ncbi:glycoside hydrolase family 25 protein [Erythrobacter litoralis]|uniref:Lysozyme n=1 Tax=Erythrobacter litoralis (strain HTCC2594) TaxID=314225 RepID=Q2N7Q7_ERYLH|nr:glycoside hydrolase family 25 protein [Erythrobacter litoralis]ABC64284.1 lysozyme precursor [Erythrobacter litoralis HTCC2594]